MALPPRGRISEWQVPVGAVGRAGATREEGLDRGTAMELGDWLSPPQYGNARGRILYRG